MLRKTHAAGWGLLAMAVVVAAVVVTVGALRAHGDAAFNHWVGWATVAALPVAAVGVVLVLWEKIAAYTEAGELDIEKIEAELAAVVLAQAQVTRSQLIGADEAGDEAANVRFAKESGRFREVGGAAEGDLTTVLTYYQSLSPRRMVVLGEPGAGKTVLALELLIRLLEDRQHEPSIPVPMLISAAAYDTQFGWQDWLSRHLALRFGISKAAARMLVRDGRILPVIDGLDEMDPTDGAPERASGLVTVVNASIRGRKRAPVVVTCRRREYRALVRRVDRATHIEMLPLTGQEAAEYLRGQFLSQDENDRWEPVLAALDDNPSGPLAGQLATPWRLTLALVVFRDSGDPATLLPPLRALTRKAAKEYRRHIDRLLLGSYVSSAVHRHDSARRYSLPEVQQWLTNLADGLAWQADHSGSSTDIQLDRWWQPAGRWATRLAHVTLAAVPALPWLVASAASGSLPYLFIAAATLLEALVACCTRPPFRIRVQQMTTPVGLRRLAWMGVGGVVLGLTLGLTFGLASGLAFGLAFGLGGGLALGVIDYSPQAIGPRDIIRADGECGLIITLETVLVTMLMVGFMFGFAYGLGIGLAVALTTMIALGIALWANAWARYHVTVMIIAARKLGPLQFGAFLDWAQQAGLLRVSGVTYQFRHRQLQDWLTSPRDGHGGVTGSAAAKYSNRTARQRPTMTGADL